MTLDAMTCAETGKPSATMPAPSSLNGLWSISRRITPEPINTHTTITTTMGAGTEETLGVSLSGNGTNSLWNNTPPTLSSPISMTKTSTTMTMVTMESAEMEYLHGRAATPKSYVYRGGGDSKQESNNTAYGRNGLSLQGNLPSPGPGKSSAGTSAGPCFNMTSSPDFPHLLIQWLQFMVAVLWHLWAAYAFVKKVLGRPQSHPQPCDAKRGKNSQTSYFAAIRGRPGKSRGLMLYGSKKNISKYTR